MPQSVVLSVPTTMLRTPKLGVSSELSGAQSSIEKNSLKDTSWKKPIVGVSSEITIAVVVTTETTAQAASRPWIGLLAAPRASGTRG